MQKLLAGWPRWRQSLYFVRACEPISCRAFIKFLRNSFSFNRFWVQVFFNTMNGFFKWNIQLGCVKQGNSISDHWYSIKKIISHLLKSLKYISFLLLVLEKVDLILLLLLYVKYKINKYIVLWDLEHQFQRDVFV